MANAPLQPIVIAAIVSGLFECLGDGLLYEGIGREQPNTLKDLLVPTKASKRTAIEDKERPKKWWRAQCLHYGLPAPASASISTYRAHLENAVRQRGGLKRPQELSDLEFEQNAKFRRLNAEVRDATSGTNEAPKAKGKAKAQSKVKPKADVEPAKATGSKKRKAETVIHVYHHDGDHPAAPTTAAKRPSAKKARTVAPSAPAPVSVPVLISNSFPGYSQDVPQQPAMSQTIRTGVPGKFSGTYELDCTSEENWPSYEKPTLHVIMSRTSSVSPWFKALLVLPNFLTCILRPKPNMPWAEDGYVRFEWCGREEGEGKIEPPDASNAGWLKMYKSEGRVRGMIQTTFGEFLFQGPRVGTDPPTIEYEWEDFSLNAYHDANHARW